MDLLIVHAIIKLSPHIPSNIKMVSKLFYSFFGTNSKVKFIRRPVMILAVTAIIDPLTPESNMKAKKPLPKSRTLLYLKRILFIAFGMFLHDKIKER